MATERARDVEAITHRQTPHDEPGGGRLEDPAQFALEVDGTLDRPRHGDTGDVQAETNDLEAALNPFEESLGNEDATSEVSEDSRL